MIKKIIAVIFLLICSCSFSQSNEDKVIDSIQELYKKTIDVSKSNIEKLVYSEQAKNLAIQIKNDSLLNESYRRIAIFHWRLKNYNLYKRVSREYLNSSIKHKDSINIARAYSNLGKFYYNASQSDSAYFYYNSSEKIYRDLKNYERVGAQLLNLAIIQKNEKDFIGSEVTSIEAISILEPLEKTKNLSNLYNNLGIIYNELADYKQSIEYHEKALTDRKKLKDNKLINESYNNLAVVYKNAKQYKKALENFDLILNDTSVRKERPSFYALVLDNYAHTKFLLKDTSELPKLYFDALKITDSLNESYNAIAINKHLAEYYNSKSMLDSTKHYAYISKELASKFHNDDYLKSLLFLSKIEADSLSVKFYDEYITLNDSLIKNERGIRNKLARIRYETKEIEKENEQMSRENLLLIILSIGLLLTIFLTYSVISQRAKNKELLFNKQQQEANEEIYNLMLSQQDKIEEGRAQEKKRISEDLHDGILGRLFGTRLSLDSLNNNNNDDSIKNRSVYIDELKSIEEEIRRISHDLNSDFIDGTGFFDIIKTLVETQTKAYNLKYDLINDDDINWESVSNKTKINFYRITQESLQNIYKHAEANHVRIVFELIDEKIQLTLEDNGTGFVVNKAKKGIGIKNINSRVNELNGEVEIMSEPNSGTSLKIIVPK